MGGWTFEPWDTSFYPDKLSKAKQLQLCQPAGADHRGQRHLLFDLQAADLRQMGGRRAGRFCLFAEGHSLLDQPQGAGRGRRVRAALPRLRRLGARRQARADPLAVRADQKIRCRRFRRVPEAAAGKAGWRETAPCGRGPDRLASSCRNSSRSAARTTWQSSMPTTKSIRRFPTSPATSSMRGCRPARTTFRPATSRRRSTSGPSARRSGRRARRLTIFPAPIPSSDAPVKPRDVFVYFITSGKVRAPHGAMAFMERV